MNAMPASAPMPLFDRLCGKLLATEDDEMRDPDGLQHSLRQDMVRLFNVRNGLTIEQFLSDSPTALHYGLPDTLGMSPQSAADIARWELVVARAIALYEPRLSQVHVHITHDDHHPAAARINIDAAVALGWHVCRVYFHVLLNDGTAQLAAAA
ncbi:type VI secretion system protein ImpF [Janthinobacterium sp. CG_23.3]|uniref:type VI secretion system baseplate subunit TssE n=1 Tax=Janthinobacterium sp. CG_23.3 TaxID=3349634 RepID=UPI0038D436A7